MRPIESLIAGTASDGPSVVVVIIEEETLRRFQREIAVWLGSSCDGARGPSLMHRMLRSIGIGTASFRHVLEGDYTFHILAREDRLFLPFHENLDVGGHGERCNATIWVNDDRRDLDR